MSCAAKDAVTSLELWASATAPAADVLSEGGNAADAAVATALCQVRCAVCAVCAVPGGAGGG